MKYPLMPKATAIWLVENTALTFTQIADFCGLHELEIQGIADGEVAVGMRGYDPIDNNQLTKAEIERCEKLALLLLLRSGYIHIHRFADEWHLQRISPEGSGRQRGFYIIGQKHIFSGSGFLINLHPQTNIDDPVSPRLVSQVVIHQVPNGLSIFHIVRIESDLLRKTATSTSYIFVAQLSYT